MPMMEKLAQPDPLGAAVAGAMVGDIVASGTGLMIPTRFKDPVTGVENVAWNDRAGLVESVWEESAGKLAQPFDPTVSGPTGALVLNSTDTGTGCRVVISQIDLPSARDTQTTGSAKWVVLCFRAGFPFVRGSLRPTGAMSSRAPLVHGHTALGPVPHYLPSWQGASGDGKPG
ncbi:hypothetical protein NHF46_18905 [Arthrobacter alpinus]|nr:hypothetical protein [Arthrobacter alpinus]